MKKLLLLLLVPIISTVLFLTLAVPVILGG